MHLCGISLKAHDAHLGVNPHTICKYIEIENLPARKVGRLWKFSAAEVDEWVKGGRAAQGEAGE